MGYADPVNSANFANFASTATSRTAGRVGHWEDALQEFELALLDLQRLNSSLKSRR